MDRFSALGELPVLHAVAIRLRDEGVERRVIAAALAVAPEDVPALLDIAEAKLARLEAEETTPLTTGARSGFRTIDVAQRDRDEWRDTETHATQQLTSPNRCNEGEEK